MRSNAFCRQVIAQQTVTSDGFELILLTFIQGSDGYHRHWKGYGQIYTGPIHEGNYGQKDYLQIQDLVTGEVEYFRFRFT
jgi:hypothetical protein